MPTAINSQPVALSLLILVTGIALPGHAQTRLPKPIIGTPTVVTGPASLTATATPGQIGLDFPPVANGEAYRVTRRSNALGSGGETTIYEGPITTFVSQGYECSTSSSQPNCLYRDTRVINPRLTYTYRVWTIYPGPLVSPPSPSATVQAR